MHRKAVNGHLSILSSLKEFFRYIKYYEVNNESYKFFNLSDHLISLNVLKRRTFYVYQNLLNSSYNVYNFNYYILVFHKYFFFIFIF